ncbi:MAG: endolytic transglycosylase MltG [Prevotellaceae bacterium]|nr:endolytic transglycosylase MltG [Prevotellaceae bacterium]
MKYLIAILICLACAAAAVLYGFSSSFNSSDEPQYVYIDDNDNIDTVYSKLQPLANAIPFSAFKTLVSHTSYPEHIKSGRYQINDEGAFKLFRKLRGGMQEPTMLTVPSVRTMPQMAARLSQSLMCDSIAIAEALSDSSVLNSLGFTKETIPSMFIPNTYDIYWNVSVEKLLQRIRQEYDRFWTSERQAKAKAMGLTQTQVATIASIVDEETNKTDEKPTIAGLYYNRYLKGMKLQADPTVKFAMQDFGIRRILNSMLTTDSPYNTYMYAGLPPGPIRVPSQESIDAVLNYEHHNYIYMCAKEDFSGYHNFAVTSAEHLANAHRYAAALNARGIR